MARLVQLTATLVPNLPSPTTTTCFFKQQTFVETLAYFNPFLRVAIQGCLTSWH